MHFVANGVYFQVEVIEGVPCVLKHAVCAYLDWGSTRVSGRIHETNRFRGQKHATNIRYKNANWVSVAAVAHFTLKSYSQEKRDLHRAADEFLYKFENELHMTKDENPKEEFVRRVLELLQCSS